MKLYIHIILCNYVTANMITYYIEIYEYIITYYK